ncbi:hypothetical protein BCR35DRAFT_289657 [Leucosporidium creatinivorum]|uniref:NmrA-like domain-containing protein n=1 Tax=Leucosporidium creatinivorum TaxID=106004 RepID=A0A1Y2FRL4_9BASI|nr:hypothetical protein BCR35DRAFT_289657 [Leucosporidium creatinivorum]
MSSTTTSTTHTKKRILLIGGTGAQGQVVVRSIAPGGENSPYSLRILTRDPTNKRVQELYGDDDQVELVKGSFMDFKLVEEYMKGCYGVFVNTDGTVEGPANEVFAGIKLYEMACRVGVKHFIYSSIPYTSKLAGFYTHYDPQHMDTRGRVTDYLRSQPSAKHGPEGLSWTVIQIGLYVENLNDFMAPQILADGTRNFELPLKDGHVFLYGIEDGAYWIRKAFDQKNEYSGVVFDALSEAITGADIAKAYTETTGQKATYTPVDFDAWADSYPRGIADKPISSNDPSGLTWRDNFRMFWNTWADDAILHSAPDLTARRILHPEGCRSVKQWMKSTRYDGTPEPILRLTKQ